MSGEKADQVLFAKAVANSARTQFSDATVAKITGKADPDIALQLGSIVEQEDPGAALDLINRVITYIEEGGTKVTLRDVDQALDVSDQVVGHLKKVAAKETREEKAADKDLSLPERAWRFLGGENDRIRLAKTEAKQALRARKEQEKSRDQNTRLDDAIDAMIITQVMEVSPSFRTLVESQDDLSGVLTAVDSVKDAADSLSTAGVNDAIDVDLGNALINAAMESADNVGVLAAREEVEEAVAKLNRVLKKFDEKDFEAVRSAFAEFVDMIDVSLELLDGVDGFSAFDALDLMGALQTMDDADEIRDKALEIEAAFTRQLRATEEIIVGVVAKIREDLGVQ